MNIKKTIKKLYRKETKIYIYASVAILASVVLISVAAEFSGKYAPDSVSNLTNNSYASSYINWTWTDPSMSYSFYKVEIYIDGQYMGKVDAGVQYYNATDLLPGTNYTIGTQTIDERGYKINDTLVEDTETTAPAETTPTPTSTPTPTATPTSAPTLQTTINWSGYTWNVVNDSWSGNNFSDSTDNVFVDNNGNLHLRITNRNGIWYSAEIVSSNSVSYGTFTTSITSDISKLDKNVDAGIFYYNNANADEIDAAEFSRWGSSTLGPNVEYNIWLKGINDLFSGYLNLNTTTNLTNKMIWYSNNTYYFETRDGYGNLLNSWIPGTYQLSTGSHFELELWLYNGVPPSDGSMQEVIISSFQYNSE